MMLIPEDVWEKLNQRLKDGETARAELAKQLQRLNISEAKAVARADEAGKLAADIELELELEREKAQQVQHDLRTKLEGTVAELSTERDGLKVAFDETKTELAQVRKNYRDESSSLRLLAAELGLTTKEITEHELEGKLFSFIRGEIRLLAEASRQEESERARLYDVSAILEESGLRSKTGKELEDLTEEEWQRWRMDIARTLVKSWLTHRPERLAVRALNDEQRQVIAKDKSDLEQKHRPTYPRRVDLLNRLGALPLGFVESGALLYRDDWDQELGGDTIDVARFDAFVGALPRYCANSSISSWSKLSKAGGIDKRTLHKYERFLDLKQWLPKANGQSQQEDDASQAE